MADARTFSASFSVRIDTRRVRFELAEAPDLGGPEGLYRVRVDRRWLDDADGRPRFFDRTQLAALVTDAALGDLPGLRGDEPAPDLPVRTRVSVRRWRDGEPYCEGGWTVAPPVRAHRGPQGGPHDGAWLVPVTAYGRGVVYVPVSDCVWRQTWDR